MRALEFLAHVHDFHGGQRPIFHPRGHAQQPVFPAPGVLVAFQRRRGRAEQHDGTFQFAPHHRGVASVIARGFLLLVGSFVLFIHDDQSRGFERGKHGRAGADHHPGLAPADTPPLPRAFGIWQRTVQHRHGVAERGATQAADAQRQGNFRHQQQRAATARERFGYRAQIDFGFAAAGHAVQQADDEFSCSQPATNLLEAVLLLRIQHAGGRSKIGFQRVVLHGQRLLPASQPTLALQACDDSAGDTGPLEQLRQRQRAVGDGQRPMDAFLDGTGRCGRIVPGQNLLHALRATLGHFVCSQASPAQQTLSNCQGVPGPTQLALRQRLCAALEPLEQSQLLCLRSTAMG